MFFGLEVKSNQGQAKPITLANSLKLSQAVLDPSKNGKKEPVSLVVEYNKKQFILCVIDPAHSWQCPLDLIFEGGSAVKFFIRGSGTVHLTGYENFDDLDDMSMSMSSDEFEDASDSEIEAITKPKVPAIKGPPQKSPKTNGVKGPSKRKAPEPVPDDDDDDDESDDEDFAADLDDDDDQADDESLDDEDMDDDDMDEEDEDEEDEDEE